MIHRVAFRVAGEAPPLLAGRVGGKRTEARCSSPTPEALVLQLASTTASTRRSSRAHPEIPEEHAIRGFAGVRAYASPGRSAAPLLAGLPSTARARVGVARRPRRLLRLRRAAAVARRAGRRHCSPRRVAATPLDEHERWVSGPRRGGRCADAGDRPLLVPLDLLPRAERRPVRDRDARPRASPTDEAARAPRREADPAAGLRAPARAGRAATDAAAEPARGARDRPRARRRAGEPEGALVLFHGRGADEHDLFPLLDVLDPERRLRRLHPARAALAAARRRALVRRPARRLPRPATRSTPSYAGGVGAGSTRCRTSGIVLGGFSQGCVMSLALGLGAGRPRPAAIVALLRLHPGRRGLAARPRAPLAAGRARARHLRPGDRRRASAAPPATRCSPRAARCSTRSTHSPTRSTSSSSSRCGSGCRRSSDLRGRAS